jgi:hypothetical protein
VRERLNTGFKAAGTKKYRIAKEKNRFPIRALEDSKRNKENDNKLTIATKLFK